jgi:hypothetical protein
LPFGEQVIQRFLFRIRKISVAILGKFNRGTVNTSGKEDEGSMMALAGAIAAAALLAIAPQIALDKHSANHRKVTINWPPSCSTRCLLPTFGHR